MNGAAWDLHEQDHAGAATAAAARKATAAERRKSVLVVVDVDVVQAY